MLTERQQTAAAKAFAKKWAKVVSEKQKDQSFWNELLESLFGIQKAEDYISYQKPVKLQKSTQYIDAYIPATRVLIEHKSANVALDKPIQRGPGKKPVSPYGQAKEYADHMRFTEKPRWIVTCNFLEFWIYDMDEPENLRKPIKIALANLAKDYKKLNFLVETRDDRQVKEKEISIKAGDLVAEMYNLLQKQYVVLSPDVLKSLNILCMRVVFCLYAEDAGVFEHAQFHNYMSAYSADDFGERLEKLFEVLDTPEDQRSQALSSQLMAFPYTNGGLFAQKIAIPAFSNELRSLILDRASAGFDWSDISPTIFGALFESTINPETRQQGGMHYTSIENIHKVIDPLFLDDLRAELDSCLRKHKNESDVSQRHRLAAFQDKLASLRFLDPACGSGNFLTETYLSLRELENTVIRALSIVKDNKKKKYIGTGYIASHNPIKVSIDQFYGIEINDFAVSVASVALWISEAKMLRQTEDIVGHEIEFLPLKSNANIVEGNALRMEWPQVDYIMGNPPFVGYSLQTPEQKDDLAAVCPECGRNVDYVTGWFYQAASSLKHGTSRAALVSTNSITQGEQVAAVWKPLIEKHDIRFDFAHRTFRWDNEAASMAHVHCVVVGFHHATPPSSPTLYQDGIPTAATHINAYLLDAPDVWIESRNRALGDVPMMVYGSKPTDGGNLFLTADERDALASSWKYTDKYVRRFVGADEFLNRRERYCLWLRGADPSELRQSTEVMQRLEAVRQMRQASPKEPTRRCAATPALFQEDRQPDTNYIIVPCHSSEQRQYIPIGFMSPDVICGNANLMIPDATLYHFGILTSSVHMAWMRAVCGRLKSDYRYSKDIVYNNFPWPAPAPKQMHAIEQTAQAILDARAHYPDSSLADLYNPLTMPADLLHAHQQNDRAVMQAYGFPAKTTEDRIVSQLFELYIHLASIACM